MNIADFVEVVHSMYFPDTGEITSERHFYFGDLRTVLHYHQKSLAHMKNNQDVKYFQRDPETAKFTAVHHDGRMEKLEFVEHQFDKML